MRIFMNLIVAADENWAIGNKNELLVRGSLTVEYQEKYLQVL